MTTQTEALKLALECAERCESIDGMYSWADTITAIKEALAQPEQGPVAWELGAEVYWGDSPELSDYVRKEGTPLYTTPPQRKPLTDAQMLQALNHFAENPSDYQYEDPLICFARAIEAAHGIKGDA